MRIALVTTHPIQYQVPWFRALAALPEVELEVGFAWLPDAAAQGVGFGIDFTWDVPLLDGYRWTEFERVGGRPSLATFLGLWLRDVGAWLDAVRPDVVVVTGWNSLALLQAARAAQRRRLPVLVRGDSNDLARRPSLGEALHRILLRTYDGFLVVGAANRRFYLRRGVPENRLFACPHFVDNQRLAAAHDLARQQRESQRRTLGIPANAICAIFAGKMIPEKNHEEAMVALGAASAQNDRLHLLVVGNGPLRSAIEEQARRARLPVSFAGFRNQSEMPSMYAAADLLVLSSRSETWGLVVNEAMACALPAVVSDRVGCADDLVEPRVTGLTYRSGDAAELCERLLEVAGDDERRRAWGVNARRRVFGAYDVRDAVSGTLAAAQAVLAS